MQDSKKTPVVGWYQPHVAVNWDGMIPDPKTGELVKELSMTKQSFKDECDINNIVRRFEAGARLEDLGIHQRAGVFEDLPDSFDFQDAMNLVAQANAAFAALPADIRARFNNEPARFLEFTGNADNAEEMIKMGLATERVPDPEPPPMRVEVVNPPVEVKE